MDTANHGSLIHEFSFPKSKVYLMRDFAPDMKKGLSVPDPWGHGSDAFERVYAILDEAMAGFINFLRARS